MIKASENREARPGVIEVLNRSGQVQQRIAWNGTDQSIGRAYDNDIIVGDPYVCPHHLLIQLDNGAPRLRDQGSVNGTYLGKQKRRIKEIELTEETVIHFGHSQLRFRRASTRVSPAWRDISRQGPLAQFDKNGVLLILALLALACLLIDSILESRESPGPGQLLIDQLYPVLGILTWAGSWALVNRVVSHRANFRAHFSIACSGIIGLFLASQGVALWGFAMALDTMVPWVELLIEICVLTGAVYAHLRYATHGRAPLQLAIASLAGLMLFGIPASGDYLARQQFSTIPYLSPLLKPPAFRLVEGVEIETFFRDAEAIRQSLDEDSAGGDAQSVN